MWPLLACLTAGPLLGAAAPGPALQETEAAPPRSIAELFQRDAKVVEESAVELDRNEAVASYVSLVMGRLATNFVETGDPLRQEDTEALFDDGSRGVVRQGGAVEAEGRSLRSVSLNAPLLTATDWSEGILEIDEGTGLEDAIDDLRGAFAEIETRLGGRPTRGLEIAIKAATPAVGEPGEFYVRLRVRAVRSGGAGSAEGGPPSVAEARWLMRWRVDGDDRRIVGMASFIVRSSALGKGTGGFVDVAGSVLQGPSVQALVPSIPELRSNLDASFGVGVLGHHGVSVADINGDGLDDLYLCQPGGIANQLWLRGRGGESVEVAAAVGLDFIDATSSALFLDLDADGDKDAVFAIGSGLRVFTCKGNSYVQSRYIVRSGVTGLAAADVDGDGRLDLYACAYAGPYAGGSLPMPYHDAENGERNILLMNRTEKADELIFADETRERGLEPGATRFSFAAAFEDVDGDADSDLYVANDFGRNALYLNDGTGRFHEAAEAAGVVDIAAGMAASFGDLNGDGAPDLYVSNMESSAGRRVTGSSDFLAGTELSLRAIFEGHAKGNSLYLNTGGGTFQATDLATQGRWAWGSIPIDLDGNGKLDIFVPNGFVTGTGGERPDL